MATSSRVLLQTLRRYTTLSAVRLHQVLARVTIRMSSNATVSFGPVDAHIVPCDSFQTIHFTFAGSALSIQSSYNLDLLSSNPSDCLTAFVGSNINCAFLIHCFQKSFPQLSRAGDTLSTTSLGLADIFL